MKRSRDSSVTQTQRPTFTKLKCLRFRNQSRSVDVFTPSRSAALLKRSSFRIESFSFRTIDARL
jgi:hypothetical protein